MNFRIAEMSETDIDQVLSLENISFQKPWLRSAFLEEIWSDKSISLVAIHHHSEIIGFICSRLVIDELSLLKIAVSPEMRYKGVGQHLLSQSLTIALKKGANKVFLEVRPSNHGALAFYRNFGFQLIGTRPNYYSETGEDALVMARSFSYSTINSLKENKNEY